MTYDVSLDNDIRISKGLSIDNADSKRSSYARRITGLTRRITVTKHNFQGSDNYYVLCLLCFISVIVSIIDPYIELILSMSIIFML